MGKKKVKKYQQAISSPYWETTQGAPLAEGLRGLISKLFGGAPAQQQGPTRQEIIDYHLTAREREIAYLAALGFTDKEIADALVMNFQTVRVHLCNILNKMQLDEISELHQYFSPRDRR